MPSKTDLLMHHVAYSKLQARRINTTYCNSMLQNASKLYFPTCRILYFLELIDQIFIFNGSIVTHSYYLET